MGKKNTNPLQSVYRRKVKNILRRIEKATQRGFAFKDISNILKEPKIIKQETINKLRKFKGEKLYHYATYYDTEGKKYTGEKGRKIEQSFWGREGARRKQIKLKQMEFEREVRERQLDFINKHNLTDREKEIYLNEGEDALYAYWDALDNPVWDVFEEPEPDQPKMPNHKGGYDRIDHYDIDVNDAILMRVEDEIDGWTPQTWWLDSQIETKSWRRGRVQIELYDAISELGREAVAKSCEEAGQTLLDKLQKVLYDSESERNQSEIDEAQDYCLSVFWNTAYTVTTAKTISRELEESWID